MRKLLKIKGYYFITGGPLSRRGDAADVRDAVKAGARVIQYRDKNASSERMYGTAKKLKRLCKNALFIVNDRIDIAMAVGADGVHLGQQDIPLAVARRLLGEKKVIGVSVRTAEQARRAVAGKADYLAVGPVFPTSTKKDAGSPLGVDLIRRLKARFDIPVVAIGGITLDNAPDVIAAGADALCAISPVVTGRAVSAEVKKFQALFGVKR
ncbi:MAG TPA: thiamine phosphate synthase [Candidatus Omnitrophota bacterium]|nr:thiamine phosphate synthase [Candidatus Omnitrophota bacterium]HQJ15583.1 thiamine phosphate synthase [Candidatus Omnitrophota bacterium]